MSTQTRMPLSIRFAIGLSLLNLLFLVSILLVLQQALQTEPEAGSWLADMRTTLVPLFDLDLAKDLSFNMEYAFGKLLLPFLCIILELFLLWRGKGYIFLWVVLVLHMTMTFPLFGFPLAEILVAALLLAVHSRNYFSFGEINESNVLDD